MRFVIAYDIEDDGVRLRVSKLLERHGKRVQRSVFECLLDPDQLAAVVVSLQRELGSPQAGDVRVYRLCAGCLKESFGLGDLKEGVAGGGWVVV